MVHLELESRPENVALVRAMLRGIGDRLGFDLELLDDLTTTVSEACNNVVIHAYEAGHGPMIVDVQAQDSLIEASVRDFGAGFRQAASAVDHVGVGLPLISALADQAEFLTNAAGGTDVRMCFDVSGRHADNWLPDPLALDTLIPQATEVPELPEQHTPSTVLTDGDVVGTVAPATLVDGVLGRLGRMMAARAHFSLERFSDLYVLFDVLGSQARSWTRRNHVDFAMSAERRRLQLRIGPVDADVERILHLADRAPRHLRQLVDEVTLESAPQSQMLRVVVYDRAA